MSGTPAWASRNTVKARARQRLASGQAPVVVEVVVPVALPPDERDDAEGAADHERVGGQVEQRRRDARRRCRLHADQDEPGVVDRRVGQHPLHVGLHDGEHRADQQRERRRARRRSAASRAGRCRRSGTNTRSSPAKPAAFTPEAMKATIGRGRALVDVGRPGVERHGRDLEAEADQQQGEAGEQQAVVGRARGAWPGSRRSSTRLVEPVAP